MNGNKIMVKYLCEQGANVTLVDNESHSLIHWITGYLFDNKKESTKILIYIYIT